VEAKVRFEALRCAIGQQQLRERRKSVDPTRPYRYVRREVERMLSRYDDATKERLEQLEVDQKKRLDCFEREWREWREWRPEQYRNASKELVGMRSHLPGLLQAGCFDEAAKVKSRADALEAREARRAQARLLGDDNATKREFVGKQGGGEEGEEGDGAEARVGSCGDQGVGGGVAASGG
jgi:hypothetical protein